MKKILQLSFLLLAVVVFNSCTKDSDVFIVDPGQIIGPSNTWFSAVTTDMAANSLQKSLAFSTDKDSFDIVNTNYTVNFASGLQCTFPGNAFVDNSGTPVAGKVTVESYLLKKRGDLIRMFKPTISNDRVLVSGGSFFIQGKKDDADLRLADYKKIKLHFASNYTSTAMRLFDVDETSSTFNWAQCSDTLNNNNKVVPYGDGYDIYTNKLQWLNCNYFSNIGSNDSVKISLTVPTNFTNANTLAYIVFNDQLSVLSMTGDALTKTFISGAIAAEKNVQIVTITKEGNFYYLGYNSFITSKQSDGSYQKVNIEPAKISLDGIKDFLNNL